MIVQRRAVAPAGRAKLILYDAAPAATPAVHFAFPSGLPGRAALRP